MGYTIQVNPQAEANHMSRELYQLIDRFAEDFEMRHCALEPRPDVIHALREFSPLDDDEREAIDRLLKALEAREPVELLIGW